MSESTKPTGLALLREPFPANQISQLPKPYKKDSPKGKCPECGQFHALPAMHLSYVGHAALTDRLLDADPKWTWEPLAWDENQMPRFDGFGGLWIKLTVCGVSRFGYGDAQDKKGPNAVKEAIGDALRNAAMRFGAALDLWHKGGDLHGTSDDGGDESQGETSTPPMPKGYREWLTDLEAAADEGTDTLRGAWTVGAPEGCKAYLTAHGGGTEPLKARAAKATVTA